MQLFYSYCQLIFDVFRFQYTDQKLQFKQQVAMAVQTNVGRVFRLYW